MDTETKTFEDGSWWEFRTFLTHKASEETVAASRQFWTMTEPPTYGDKGEVLSPPKYTIDWSIWHPGPADRAMLFHSTVAWSYGPVNEETLDLIRGEHSDYVVKRMNELYASPLVVLAQNGSQSSSSAL